MCRRVDNWLTISDMPYLHLLVVCAESTRPVSTCNAFATLAPTVAHFLPPPPAHTHYFYLSPRPPPLQTLRWLSSPGVSDHLLLILPHRLPFVISTTFQFSSFPHVLPCSIPPTGDRYLTSSHRRIEDIHATLRSITTTLMSTHWCNTPAIADGSGVR